MIGQTISHYRIQERLGRGGMGEVFLAEDLRLHRSVALKLLRQRPCCEDEERSRIMREARAASALNHPNIAVIYDVDETQTPDGRLFLLSMEYVRGQTLADLMTASSLSLDDILDIVAQAADALAEAHARGVVHRDVKPSNLMVAQGRVKVLDFGLAQMQPRLRADDLTWSRDATHAPDGVFAGTPHYMSPEQALGRTLDSRSDIFSLGVVLYELLAGKRPFEGDTFVQIADAVLHRDPPPLPVRFSDIRVPEIERLMSRMLAKEAKARPRDLREMVVEFQRLRAGASPLAAQSGELTVAVAGFAGIGERAEDEWLGTGLSETVTTALQEVEGLVVWGREQLRESLRRLGVEATELAPEDAVQLGRMIGARWVLSGAYQRLGEHVRVTARVVEVESGRVLRAVKQDGRLDAIFELQDRIVAELASGLRGSVAAAHEGEETKIVAAYEALAKGLLNVRADSYESLDRAILFFERAVALDPDYVRAQIELAAALEQKANYLTAPELHERAAAILRKVLEARPRLARAWRELGMSLISLGRVRDGVENLRRALSLAPDDARTQAGLARGLFIGMADFRAAAEMFERSVERNPEAGWYWMQLAHCCALLREFKRGEKAAKRAIELQEGFLSGQQGIQLVGAYMRLGHLFALQGRARDAHDAVASEDIFLEKIDHALRSRIRIELQMRLGASLLELVDRTGANAAFEAGLEAFTQRLALGADEPFTRYYAAAIHALRGQNDEAVDLLERAASGGGRAFMIARARIEPEWNGLRNSARFARLIE